MTIPGVTKEFVYKTGFYFFTTSILATVFLFTWLYQITDSSLKNHDMIPMHMGAQNTFMPKSEIILQFEGIRREQLQYYQSIDYKLEVIKELTEKP